MSSKIPSKEINKEGCGSGIPQSYVHMEINPLKSNIPKGLWRTVHLTWARWRFNDISEVKLKRNYLRSHAHLRKIHEQWCWILDFDFLKTNIQIHCLRWLPAFSRHNRLGFVQHFNKIKILICGLAYGKEQILYITILNESGHCVKM